MRLDWADVMVGASYAAAYAGLGLVTDVPAIRLGLALLLGYVAVIAFIRALR